MGLVHWGVTLTVVGVLYKILTRITTAELPVVVDGHYHQAFEPLARVFRDNVESGREPGAAFAVYHKSVCVFDMWGGYADAGAVRPWKQDTITMLFSASKGIAAIVIATLVDKKLLDYDRPVVDYWPEFGQNHKDNITVGMLMSHQSGLVLLDTSFNLKEVAENPKKVEAVLAAQSTIWPAGRDFGYHGVTYGLYADTLVRKVDPKHRNIQQVFMEDIATPHDIDLYMNTPKEEFYRAARLQTSPKWKLLIEAVLSPKYFPILGYLILFPESLLANVAKAVTEYTKEMAIFNDPGLREVTLSSASVTGSARGLAKLYGILGKEGLNFDNSLLTAATTKKLATSLVSGVDKVTQAYTEFGPGTTVATNPKGQLVFGHTGHGGQVGRTDPTNNLGVGYLTNYISIYGMGDDPRYLDLEAALYTCMDDFLKSH